MKKVREEKIDLTLQLLDGDSSPGTGRLVGSVVAPQYLDELAVLVQEADLYPYDSKQNDYVKEEGYRVNLCGSRRALFELGRYLVALSGHMPRFPDYHVALDGLFRQDGEKPCELVVHSSTRFHRGDRGDTVPNPRPQARSRSRTPKRKVVADV